MKMYSGQIFALLGQNGAGKSSTIGILTGLLMKSEGEANIYDYDLFEEQTKVRQMMGVCP
jgi:ABC-type multidrug transport system ATPase subunit